MTALTAPAARREVTPPPLSDRRARFWPRPLASRGSALCADWARPLVEVPPPARRDDVRRQGGFIRGSGGSGAAGGCGSWRVLVWRWQQRRGAARPERFAMTREYRPASGGRLRGPAGKRSGRWTSGRCTGTAAGRSAPGLRRSAAWARRRGQPSGWCWARFSVLLDLTSP